MARKKDTGLSLDKLVPMYVKTKAQENECAKAAKVANDRIKNIMKEQFAKQLEEDNKAEYAVDGYGVTLSATKSLPASDELLDYLKAHKEFAPCIKTKEYIDGDELENLIFNGKVPQKLIVALDAYRKTTYKLNTSIAKEN